MNLIILLILLLNSFTYTEDVKQVENIQVEKKEDIKEIELYYSEFNNKYIIIIDGETYIFNDYEIINEYEDIKKYNLMNIKKDILY